MQRGYGKLPAWGVTALLGFTLVAGLAPAGRAWAQLQPAGGVVEGAVAPDMTVEQALAEAVRLVRQAEGLSNEPVDLSPEQITRNVTDAQRMVSFVLAREPLNIRAKFVLGRTSILAGRPRDAVGQIEAYAADPIGQSDWYAHKLLGDLKLPSYAKLARAHYKRSAELAPSESEALIGLARADLKLDQAALAVDSAEKAVRFDQGRKADYRAVLAEARLLNKQYREAVQAAMEAVTLAEGKVRERPGDLTSLGQLKSQYEQLVRCLGTAADAFPDDPAMIVQLAQALQDQADLDRLMAYGRALQVVEAGVRRAQPTPPADLLYEEARLNRLIGRDQLALQILEALLRANPDHAAARQLQEVITAAGNPPAAGQ